MIRTRVEPLEQDLASLLSATLSPQARSAAIAEAATAVLRETQEQARGLLGSVPSHKSYVDGRSSSDFKSVKPNGRIVLEFQLLEEAISWIAGQLRKHSPRRSGKYLSSHQLYADGAEADPQRPPDAKSYVFVNEQPYARRLEGKSNAGIYQAVAVLASRRFGRLARIQFEYRSAETGRSTPAIVLSAS